MIKEVKIIKQDKVKNSINGNPRYKFIFIDDGITLEGKTKANSGVAYRISNNMEGQ